MNHLKKIVLLAGVLLTSACVSSGGVDSSILKQTSYSDVQSVSLKVGQAAPSFTLKNAKGESVSLESVLKNKHAMLVFYRGEWCPFCVSNLESFEAVLPELAEKNVQLIGISPDSVSTNKNTQRQFGQNYLFLSDQGLNVSQLYGIKRNEKVPHPALFLIKQDGTIAWFHASKNVKVRPTGKQMLKVIEAKL